MFNLATLVYYDPYYLTDWDGAGPPKWVYLSWAAGLFFYQTFDAIDGYVKATKSFSSHI